MSQKGESKTFEANLIICRGMHSGRIAFLGFKDFIIKLMSSTVGLGKSNEAKFLKFSDYT